MGTPPMTLRSLRRLAATVLIAGLTVAPACVATAAPCAGFSDVQDTSAFCTNVEWLKNRAITLGCNSGTTYCPSNPVSRLTMAAFMNRLGNALTPIHLPVDTVSGTVDPDVGTVLCQTQDFAVEDFPRRAYADLSFNARATADVGFAADLVMTSNGGASWTNLNSVANRGFVPANRWGTLADVGSADLAVGQNVRWGVRVTRAGIAGGADLADTRCQLRVLIDNRNGTATPF
jgi:hypothetical protein